MTEPGFYHTIAQVSTAEFKDRGSRFIAFAHPISSTDAFKAILQQLKKEHPKAVHHCFAWRLGTDGNSFRVSDDGEPAGTAGRPILGQIDSRELTDTAVIVVRYWGGTLLGVPGLINAYKSAAALALQVTPIIQKQVEIPYSLHFDCTQINDVMMVLKQYNCSILQQEAQLFYTIRTGIPQNRRDEVVYKLQQLRGMELVKL